MRFEELRIRGFLSFGEKEQVIKLGKRGLVLIEGENLDDPTTSGNGSGKSSIGDALLWCLFGQTSRGVTGDDVVNRHIAGGCKVTVKFTTDKGDAFRVERYRKDDEEKNKLLFTGPTGGFTANETSETEAKVREALGMDFDTFTSAVVFGQGAQHFASLTDKGMKNVTDKLVGVEALTAAHTRAYEDYRNMQDELDVLKRELKDTEALERTLSVARNDLSRWKALNLKSIALKESEMEGLKAQPMRALTEAVDRLTSELADLKSERKILANAAAAALAEARSASEKLCQAEEALDKVLTEPGTCEYCGQQVTAKGLAAHEAHLKEVVDRADSLSTTTKQAKVRAEEKLDKHDTRISKAERALDAAKKEVNEAVVLATKADELRKSIVALKATENPHQKAVQRAEKALDEAKTHNVAVEAALADLQKDLEAQEFVVSMFSNKGANGNPPLKALLVESVAPFINKRLAHYARALTGGNVDITFETQKQLKSGEYRDAYALNAVNQHGASAYEGASGGERRKIDVAVFLALQDLAASRSQEQVRLLLVDEVFDALDETAQEVMVELLLEEQQKRDTVLVITHREELKAFFPQRILVRKEGGSSRLVT